MLLDEPFAGVDPIAVHDIQTIVAGLRHRGHRRADHRPQRRADARHRGPRLHHVRGQGPGRRHRARARVRRAGRPALPGADPDGPAPGPTGEASREDRALAAHSAMRQELRINPRLYQAMDMLYMPMMDLQQHLKQELLVNPVPRAARAGGGGAGRRGPRDGQGAGEGGRPQKEEEMDWEEILLNGFDVGGDARAARAARVHRAGHGARAATSSTTSASSSRCCDLTPAAACSWPRSSSATSTTTATWRPRWRRSSARSTS